MLKSPSLRESRRATVLGCPRCSGVLYEMGDRDTVRLCCDHGHTFTLDDITPGVEEDLRSLLDGTLEAFTSR